MEWQVIHNMAKAKENNSKKEKVEEEIIEETEESEEKDEELEQEINSNEFQEFLEPRKITAPVLEQIATFENPTHLEQEVSSFTESEEQDKERKELYKIKSFQEDYKQIGLERADSEKDIIFSPEFRDMQELERIPQRIEKQTFKGNLEVQELRKASKNLEQDYVVNIRELKENRTHSFFEKIKKDYEVNP